MEAGGRTDPNRLQWCLLSPDLPQLVTRKIPSSRLQMSLGTGKKSTAGWGVSCQLGELGKSGLPFALNLTVSLIYSWREERGSWLRDVQQKLFKDEVVPVGEREVWAGSEGGVGFPPSP